MFTCRAGEIHAVVGPSGSGKSTLMRLLAGLLRPSKGRIALGERVWFDSSGGFSLTPQERRLGYVSQFHGLFPHLSAIGNIRAGLLEVPGPERTRQAQQWLERVGLEGLGNRKPAALSGGQRQRVALARALARQPGVLLLDEPFSSVDRVTREALHTEVAGLRERLNIPMVLVTHDLDEARLLAQQMSLMLDGALIQTGSPRELLARPASEEAAAMLGQQNCFDGHWQDGVLVAGPHRLVVSDGPSRDGPVRWMLPAKGVRLRAMFKENLPEGPNRVRLEIGQVIRLGDDAIVTGQVRGLSAPLRLRLTGRLCDELGLAPGRQTDVLLRSEDIHIFAGILNK